MRQSLRSVTSTAGTANKKVVNVVLLNKEEVQIYVEPKAKAQEVFNQVCDHISLREADYFGLAVLLDGEYHFVDLENKISKYTPKSWKTGNGCDSNGRPVFTLYFRVQFYVDHELLLRERICRQHYYLQLKENVQHCHLCDEERCFYLASFALQADLGNFLGRKHTGVYFDPREYFPAWVISKHGEEYITQNMPSMHRDLRGMTKSEAQLQFIREASTSPAAHNLHFYRLRKRKNEDNGSIFLGICAKGIEIYEEVEDDFKSLLSTFLWPSIGKLYFEKKKFEIRTIGTPEGRKFTYYTGSDERSKYLLHLCRTTHMFQMAMAPKLAEIKHLEAEDKRRSYRESYIYSDSSDLAWEQEQASITSSVSLHNITSLPKKGGDPRISVISNTSSNTTSGIVSDKMHISFDDSEVDEREGEMLDPSRKRDSYLKAHSSMDSLACSASLGSKDSGRRLKVFQVISCDSGVGPSPAISPDSAVSPIKTSIINVDGLLDNDLITANRNSNTHLINTTAEVHGNIDIANSETQSPEGSLPKQHRGSGKHHHHQHVSNLRQNMLIGRVTPPSRSSSGRSQQSVNSNTQTTSNSITPTNLNNSFDSVPLPAKPQELLSTPTPQMDPSQEHLYENLPVHSGGVLSNQEDQDDLESVIIHEEYDPNNLQQHYLPGYRDGNLATSTPQYYYPNGTSNIAQQIILPPPQYRTSELPNYSDVMKQKTILVPEVQTPGYSYHSSPSYISNHSYQNNPQLTVLPIRSTANGGQPAQAVPVSNLGLPAQTMTVHSRPVVTKHFATGPNIEGTRHFATGPVELEKQYATGPGEQGAMGYSGKVNFLPRGPLGAALGSRPGVQVRPGLGPGPTRPGAGNQDYVVPTHNYEWPSHVTSNTTVPNTSVSMVPAKLPSTAAQVAKVTHVAKQQTNAPPRPPPLRIDATKKEAPVKICECGRLKENTLQEQTAAQELNDSGEIVHPEIDEIRGLTARMSLPLIQALCNDSSLMNVSTSNCSCHGSNNVLNYDAHAHYHSPDPKRLSASYALQSEFPAQLHSPARPISWHSETFDLDKQLQAYNERHARHGYINKDYKQPNLPYADYELRKEPASAIMTSFVTPVSQRHQGKTPYANHLQPTPQGCQPQRQQFQPDPGYSGSYSPRQMIPLKLTSGGLSVSTERIQHKSAFGIA